MGRIKEGVGHHFFEPLEKDRRLILFQNRNRHLLKVLYLRMESLILPVNAGHTSTAALPLCNILSYVLKLHLTELK